MSLGPKEIVRGLICMLCMQPRSPLIVGILWAPKNCQAKWGGLQTPQGVVAEHRQGSLGNPRTTAPKQHMLQFLLTINCQFSWLEIGRRAPGSWAPIGSTRTPPPQFP